MIPVTPQSGGGSYGGFAGYGNNQYGGINSDLLQMLHQLIRGRLAVEGQAREGDVGTGRGYFDSFNQFHPSQSGLIGMPPGGWGT